MRGGEENTEVDRASTRYRFEEAADGGLDTDVGDVLKIAIRAANIGEQAVPVIADLVIVHSDHRHVGIAAAHFVEDRMKGRYRIAAGPATVVYDPQLGTAQLEMTNGIPQSGLLSPDPFALGFRVAIVKALAAHAFRRVGFRTVSLATCGHG